METIEDFIRSSPQALARARRDRRPLPKLEVEIRLDWRCNAKCKYCGVWKYDRHGMLEPDRWKEVLNQLAEAGLVGVVFVGGEPLLYPHFDDIIAHTDKLGVKSDIITNGSLLKQRKVELLAGLRHLREVTISLDSGDPAVHDKVRKLDGLFDTAVRGMRLLRSLAPHVKLSVNTVVCADTYASIDELLKLPVLPDRIRVFPVVLDMAWLRRLEEHGEEHWAEWAMEAKGQEIPADARDALQEAMRKLAEEAMARGVELDYERMSPGSATPYHGDCFVPLAHLVIQPDGEVYPCCHVQSPANCIGSLKTQSVAELFSGASYTGFLDRLMPVRLAVCRNCSRYRHFNEVASEVLAAGPQLAEVVT